MADLNDLTPCDRAKFEEALANADVPNVGEPINVEHRRTNLLAAYRPEAGVRIQQNTTTYTPSQPEAYEETTPSTQNLS